MEIKNCGTDLVDIVKSRRYGNAIPPRSAQISNFHLVHIS